MHITEVKREENFVSVFADNGYLNGSSRRQTFNEDFLFDNTGDSAYIKNSSHPNQALECQRSYDLRSAINFERMLEAVCKKKISDQPSSFSEFINQVYQACNISGKIEED